MPELTPAWGALVHVHLTLHTFCSASGLHLCRCTLHTRVGHGWRRSLWPAVRVAALVAACSQPRW